ncbi:hypothetical protein RD110_11915 [Rhodoferax koreense]|uniref:ER-bound oxygenase mpaB/mpaB'/Rubber oxygenase catalytic domain-containing protein n=1 Tax=Rhodoferax koreensis TaxID=1842727 RepID=A0A1P8JVP2_9BURK|nr:oxygenase MpaB family protein [Rhodoferax koreense]APW37817.1 hypothetical protein RD110_11915 [Rhodoferax koreense]
MQAKLAGSDHRGDPLADAVIQEFDENPALDRALIDRGIRNGRASLATCPSALEALLRSAESPPPSADTESVGRGCAAWLTIPAFWLTVALGPGSLAHTYRSPAIAKVLMNTRNLKERTARRLAETSAWSHQVVRPDGLRPGAAGYVHTLQVRLLHARVRAATLRAHPGATGASVPISQLDLLRTWLDFTVVPFQALERLGLGFSEADLSDLYALWRTIAGLLGIEPALYGAIGNQTDAACLLEAIDSTLPAPDKDSRMLTFSMLEASGQLLAPALDVPCEVSIGLMHAFCRHIHGSDVADTLGVQTSWTRALLPALIDANRYRRQQESGSEELRRQRIQVTLQEFDAADAAIAGETTYQASVRDPSPASLPVTPLQIGSVPPG